MNTEDQAQAAARIAFDKAIAEGYDSEAAEFAAAHEYDRVLDGKAV